jgi:uncharacterized protein (UPF0333 family)
MRRAQVTLEYLFLSLIGITLISFSVISLANIKDTSEEAYENTLFKSGARALASAMDEACALGDGNSRVVYVKARMDISGDQTSSGEYYALFFDDEGREIPLETSCEIEGSSNVYGKTKVVNKMGKIKAET